MESTFTAATREIFQPQPHFAAAPAVTLATTTATISGNQKPMEILATSPFGDTDFRKKIGIERWGWGLND